MWVSPRILGASASKLLTERRSAHVLKIGSDKFTRADLAKVGCFNYLAAATLTRVIDRDAPAVKSIKHLFDTLHVDDLVLPSIGPIALAVLGAAFELAGVGGEYPLEAWVSSTTSDADISTFDTLKQHERKRLADKETSRRRRSAPPRSRLGRRTVRHPSTRSLGYKHL